MAIGMNIPLAFLSTFVGTVKNGQMLFFQVRSSFQHPGAAYIIISSIYFFIAETKSFQQAPLKVIILFRCKAQTLQALFTQCIFIENKSNFKCSDHGSIQSFYLISNKPFFTQRLMINEWRPGKRS